MTMKTITEFSGSVLTTAARFVKLSPPVATVVTESAAPDAAPAESMATPEATVDTEPVTSDAAPTESAAAPPTAATVDTEGLLGALGISGDRLARLIEALPLVESRLAQVSKVRVLSGEEAPPAGAKKLGDFYFVVDLIPRAVKKDDRHGGHGRDDRGGGRGSKSKGSGGPRRDGLEREPPRNEVPATGAGWTLQRAPNEPGEGRGGERRGPGGPRGRKPGGGPGGGDRGRSGKPGAGGAGGRTPGGPGRPAGAGAGRPPGGGPNRPTGAGGGRGPGGPGRPTGTGGSSI